MLRPLLDLFVETASMRVEQIAEAVRRKDSAASAAFAHAFKGESANAAAHRLQALAFELETTTRRGDWTAADKLVEEMQLSFSRVKERVGALN